MRTCLHWVVNVQHVGLTVLRPWIIPRTVAVAVDKTGPIFCK